MRGSVAGRGQLADQQTDKQGDRQAGDDPEAQTTQYRETQRNRITKSKVKLAWSITATLGETTILQRVVEELIRTEDILQVDELMGSR